MAGIELHIQKPIWNGGMRKIGIADFRLSGDYVKVYVDYRSKKTGEYIQPEIYQISTSKAREYPMQRVFSGVILHLIPIEDFEIVGMRNDNRKNYQEVDRQEWPEEPV